MLVRPASSDDVAALVAAYEWLFAPPGSQPATWDPDTAAARVRSAIAAEDIEVFVVDVDDKLAGFITVYLDIPSVRFGRRAWTEDLAVDPGRRSQGIGKALLDAAMRWSRERGASHFELDSSVARKDAHRFYEREGAQYQSISFGWEL